MVHSVELLPGEGLDRWLRAQWQALVEAGLPSLGHHQGPTNRPHVTLAVASTVTDAHEEALARALDRWRDATVRVGGFVVFGPHGRSGTFVLARQVVLTRALLDLHDAVAQAWADADGVPDTVRPGRWTPHLTLALRLDGEQLARALATTAAVDGRPDEASVPVAVRRWDGTAKRAWTVVGDG